MMKQRYRDTLIRTAKGTTATTGTRRGGLMRWLTTTNHKGHRHQCTYGSALPCSGGRGDALTIRSELFQPGLQILEPERFNQMTTLQD